MSDQERETSIKAWVSQDELDELKERKSYSPLAWGNGEPCPWCGEKVPVKDMIDHAIKHLKKLEKVDLRV